MLTLSSPAEILRVRHLVTLPASDTDRGSTDQGTSESVEPIRQQLDGQETDLKQDEAAAHEQRGQLQSAPELAPTLPPGFGQFIKSVSSPTNVRVTAGGRIVANTRGTSPTGKIYRERGPGEALVLARPGGQPGHIVATTVAGPYMQTQAIYPPYAPFPGTFYQGPMQMPMAPMSVASGPYPPQPGSYYSAPSQVRPAGEDIKSTDQKPAANAGTVQSASSGPSGPPGPNYQGPFYPQVVAVPMQMQMPVPVGMMHPQMAFQNQPASVISYAPSHPATAYSQSVASMPVPASQYSQYQTVQDVPMPPAAPTHLSDQQNSADVGNPQSTDVPASSIKLSDVIKKHLEGFRDHLKWTSNQLDYNTHQIDVKDMKNRIAQIREQIASHERRLGEQIDAEKRLDDHDKPSRSGRQSETGQRAIEKSAASSSARVPKPELTNHEGSKTYQADNDQLMPYKKDRSRPKSWNMKQRSMHLRASTDNDQVSDASSAALHLQSHNIVPEPMKKPSGLPMTAALAPPFEPRSRFSQEDLGSGSARLHDGVANLSRAHAGPSFGTAPGYKMPAAGSTDSNDLGRPYLQGKLRYGIDPVKARDDDFSYPRKLNEEELRARRLYWSKAPRTVTQGLPRFDGKDFYPPSPIKETKPAPSIKENLPRSEGGFYGINPSMPTSSYTDYILKATSSVDKTPLDGAKKLSPEKQHQYMALLEQHYLKGEMADRKAREKRSTKSDNINGSAIEGKKSFSRDRPTASLISQDRSDSDLPAKSTTEVAASDVPKTESNRSESDGSYELLFKGRRSMQRSG